MIVVVRYKYEEPPIRNCLQGRTSEGELPQPGGRVGNSVPLLDGY